MVPGLLPPQIPGPAASSCSPSNLSCPSPTPSVAYSQHVKLSVTESATLGDAEEKAGYLPPK